MTTTSEIDRQQAAEQALANTHIEGHQPTGEFLGDVQRVVKGEATIEEALAASRARALAQDEGARDQGR